MDDHPEVVSVGQQDTPHDGVSVAAITDVGQDGQRDALGRFATGNSLSVGCGAPAKNRNAIRHGLRSASLPASARFIEDQARVFRRCVRAAVTERTGSEPTLYEEALVLSVARHEQRAQLAGRWLRLEGDSLSIEQRLALLKTISDASDQRDKCLQKLGLDRKPGDADIWATLRYAPQEPASGEQATPGTEDGQ